MQTVLVVMVVGLVLVVLGLVGFILFFTEAPTQPAFKFLDDLDCLTKSSCGDR